MKLKLQNKGIIITKKKIVSRLRILLVLLFINLLLLALRRITCIA